jgi:hypothetical protein
VLLGYALATSVSTAGAGAATGTAATAGINLAYVHIGRLIYSEEWFTHRVGLGLAPATLIMHNRNKVGARIARAHRWKRRNHCQPPAVRLACLAGHYTSCTGARWRRCELDTTPFLESNCSTAITTNLFSPVSPACVRKAGRWSKRHTANAARHAGSCGVTEFGSSDCATDETGAWRISELADSSLAGCVARCACCERCRFVSYAERRDDCSWYALCPDLGKELSGGHRTGEASGRVDEFTIEVPRTTSEGRAMPESRK